MATARRRAEIGIRLALGGQPQVIVLQGMLKRIALFVLGGAVLGRVDLAVARRAS